MDTSLLRRKLPLLAALLGFVAFAPPARAEEEQSFYTSSNVQLLWCGKFNDSMLRYYTKNGGMFTLTLNNYSQFKYGDSFAFVDMYQGDFVNPFNTAQSAGNAKLYVEWHPRLFVNKMLGEKKAALGIFRNWGPAFEINVGNNFSAYMAGLGCDLELPANILVSFNVYYRYDSLWLAPGVSQFTHTWQFSPFWTVPFQIGPVPFLFTGFLDMYQYSTGWIDVMTQPELLIDVLAPFGGRGNTLFAGIELYEINAHFHETIASSTGREHR
jgi:nucleoside-specific outer membrane channel protein Tsx